LKPRTRPGPGIKECRSEVGDEVFNALLDSGELVPMSQDVVFRRQDYQELTGKVGTAIRQKGQISLAEARDMLGTSRKYVQALLEHMDSTGLTQRDGDVRRLRK
jgi:selenocysteine-specific elongation factor